MLIVVDGWMGDQAGARYKLLKYITTFNPFPNTPWFLRVCSIKSFENTAGKGEIARKEQFLLFPQRFLTIWRTFCHFHHI